MQHKTPQMSQSPLLARLARAAMLLPAIALALAACVEGNAQAPQDSTQDKPRRVVSSITMDVNNDGLPDRVDLVFNADTDVELQIVLGRKGDQEGDLAPAIVKPAIAFHGNDPAQNASLEEGKRGLFAVRSQNESVGRTRWEKTLTIAFRKGEFVVAGLSYLERDTIDQDGGGACDINFLTGKAMRNGRSFPGRNELITLKDWDPDFLPPACDF
jgi:hypothetical protein